MSRAGKLQAYLEGQHVLMDEGVESLEHGEVVNATAHVLEWFALVLEERAPEDKVVAAVVREVARRIEAQLGELADLMDALYQEDGMPWWVIACENGAADPDGDDGRLYVSRVEAWGHVAEHRARCGCSDATVREAEPEDVL